MRSRLPARRRAVALLALLASAGAVAAAGVPEDLPARVADYGAALDALAAEPASEARRAAALERHANVTRFARDLAPGAAEQLDAYAAALREARAESDVRDLARAMNRTLALDVAPAVDAWSRLRTTVLLGEPSPGADGRVRYPIVLVNPPPGGIGAFDVRVRVVPLDATLASATVALGRGEARADGATGEARLASFDAQALLGVGGAGTPVTLGHVELELHREGAPAFVDVIDLVDRDGEPVPAVGADGVLAASAARASDGALRWLAVGAVVALAGGAAFAARRYLGV